MGYKKTIVRFDAQKAQKELYARYVQAQTKNFEIFADKELELMIKNHTFTNRTYNTEDSYCWIVYFNGKMISYGLDNKSKKAVKKARFHKKEVDGRQEVRTFISKYQPKNTRGWEVVWAATTPYTTYLENGTSNAGKFLVISSQYNEIKKTFEPSGKVEFKIEY